MARFRAPTPPYKPSRALFFALCTPLPSLSAPSSPLAPPRRGATTSASYIFWRRPRSDNSRTTLGQRGFRPYNARLTFAGALFLQEGRLAGAHRRDERSPRAVGPKRGKFAVLGAGAGHHGFAASSASGAARAAENAGAAAKKAAQVNKGKNAARATRAAARTSWPRRAAAGTAPAAGPATAAAAAARGAWRSATRAGTTTRSRRSRS